MKTVAFLHGFAGGNWHTRRFFRELEENSFNLIKNSREADVVIAHSTGCYRLKEDSQASLFLLIGPPYWPSKSVLHRSLKKKRHDTKHLMKNHGLIFTINKFIWEIIYVIIKPTYLFIALKNHRYLHFLDLLGNKKVILVRNEDDYYCSPEIEQAIKKYPNVSYVSLPGGHDDLMTNPKPYVDLLKQKD